MRNVAQPQAGPCRDRCPVPEEDNDDEGVGAVPLGGWRKIRVAKLSAPVPPYRSGRRNVSKCGLDGQQ
jgi:hypothetical protein